MRLIISIMLCFLLIGCSKKDDKITKLGQELKDSEKKLEQEKKDLESLNKQKEEELKKAKEDYDKAVEENNKSGKNPGKYPFASTKLLTADDIKGLSDSDKKIMKNEILARHGFIFKDKEMKDYFSGQNWYKPKSSSVDNLLSDIEKKNLEFIK
jgi:membrane-associated protein TcaA